MNIRKLAQGQSCFMRLAGCSHNNEQTVLAHIRRGNVAGVGSKPADICGIPMCEHCHGVYDGRYRATKMTRAELDAEALRAMVQWHSWLWSNDHLKVA